MTKKLLLFIAIFSAAGFGQLWSTFLDPSRATTWEGNVGFTIPGYTVACSTQPNLLPGSGNAAANSASIQSALNSCDSTHNVVNLPSGTFYVTSITFGAQGKQVLRGTGSSAPGNVCGAGSTCLIITSNGACDASTTGLHAALCMSPANAFGPGNSATAPGTGARQCSWTAGYTQNSTSITLNGCGANPTANGLAVGQDIVLDQANDLTDNGGNFKCDTYTTSQAGGAPACSINDGTPGVNIDGRPITISGLHYTMSQKQLTTVQAISGNGTGPYTVSISPGVYFNNIHSGANPGAWFPGTLQNVGLENVYLDSTAIGASCGVSFDCATVGIVACYHCWVKGITSYNAQRAHIFLNETLQTVVRDSYLFQSKSHASVSYGVEFEQTSGDLIENNICQQVTNCVMTGNTSGSVIGYNFNVGSVYVNPNYLNTAYASHNAGNDLNLWEGNNTPNLNIDDTWGSSDVDTLFREFQPGFQHQPSGPIYTTSPFLDRSFARNHNVIGNVFGQSTYHTNYESYSTSTTNGVNKTLLSKSIYSLGWAQNSESSDGTCTSPPGTGNAACDPLVRPTLMRWGNYDTVTAAPKWDSTEASPAAVTYVNANFTAGYFNSLAHTLPASLYYSATPAWWPSGKNWPPVGPDVLTGNVGVCTGTFVGAQATSSAQCLGGTMNSAWASHVTSIPAQDCYLTTMGGAPDGTGSILGFNPATCYPPNTGGGGGSAGNISLSGSLSGSGSIVIGGVGTQVALTSIQVSPPNPIIPFNQSQTFNAQGFFTVGPPSDVTSIATWTSSNTGIASPQGSPPGNNVFQCNNRGSVTVFATLQGVIGSTTLNCQSPTFTPQGTINATQSFSPVTITQFVGANGTAPFTFTSSDLPGFLSLSNSGCTGSQINCSLVGTPSVVGIFNFHIQATDGLGNTACVAPGCAVSVSVAAASAESNPYCDTTNHVVGLAQDGPAAPLQNCLNTAIANTPMRAASTYTIGAVGIPGASIFTENSAISAATESGTTVTLTTAAQTQIEILPGDVLAVAGVGVAGYNGTFTVGTITHGGLNDTITYTNSTSGLGASSGGTATGYLVSVVTTTPTNFIAGETVTISGAGVSGYNGAYTARQVPTTTHILLPAGGAQTALANSGGGSIVDTVGTTVIKVCPQSQSGVPQCAKTLIGANPQADTCYVLGGVWCPSVQSALTFAVSGGNGGLEPICGDIQIYPTINNTPAGAQNVYTAPTIFPPADFNCGPAFGRKWLWIRTTQFANLPPVGNRVTPSWVNQPSISGRPNYNLTSQFGITSGTYMPMLRGELVGGGVCEILSSRQGGLIHGVRFMGLMWSCPHSRDTSVDQWGNHVCPADLNGSYNCSPGFFGTAMVSVGCDIVGAGPTDPPIDCGATGGGYNIFDRNLFSGCDDITMATCYDTSAKLLDENGGDYIGVIDSYFVYAYCMYAIGPCVESHAISGGNPNLKDDTVLKVTGNYIEATGVPLFQGGGNSTAGNFPTDREFRQNHFYKPLTFKPDSASFVGKVQDAWINAQNGNNQGALTRATNAVTWVSGNKFNSGMAPGTIAINGVSYTVATFNSPTSLTLSGAAATTDTNVPYVFPFADAYGAGTTCSVDPPLAGTTATCSVVVDHGLIKDVTIVNKGSGYGVSTKANGNTFGAYPGFFFTDAGVTYSSCTHQLSGSVNTADVAGVHTVTWTKGNKFISGLVGTQIWIGPANTGPGTCPSVNCYTVDSFVSNTSLVLHTSAGTQTGSDWNSNLPSRADCVKPMIGYANSKNDGEMKQTVRGLVEGNVFENSWNGASDQDGFCYLLTPKNANDTSPTVKVVDVAFRYNLCRNTAKGMEIATSPATRGGSFSLGIQRISIHDDAFDGVNGVYWTAGTSPVQSSGQTCLHMGSGNSPPYQLADIRINHITCVQTAPSGFSLTNGAFLNMNYGNSYVKFGTTPALWPGIVVQNSIGAGGAKNGSGQAQGALVCVNQSCKDHVAGQNPTEVALRQLWVNDFVCPGGGCTGSTYTANQVVTLSVTSGGACTVAPTTCSLTGGGGTGATCGITTSGTSPNIIVKTAFPLFPGQNYTSAPTVVLNGTCGTPPAITAYVAGAGELRTKSGCWDHNGQVTSGWAGMIAMSPYPTAQLDPVNNTCDSNTGGGNLSAPDWPGVKFVSLPLDANGAECNGINCAVGDLHLQAGSPFHNGANDGRDMGADMDKVLGTTTGTPSPYTGCSISANSYQCPQ